MRTFSPVRIWIVFLNVVLLTVGGLSCQKRHVAEKKEVLSLRLEHIPVNEHIGPGGQEIRATVVSNLEMKEGGTRLFYREEKRDFISLLMTPTEHEHEYSAVIPNHKKGTTVEYYIQARTAAGTPVTLPKGAIETGRSYSLIFKGDVPLGLSMIHYGCVLVGLFLILVAGYWALLFLKKGKKTESLHT